LPDISLTVWPQGGRLLANAIPASSYPAPPPNLISPEAEPGYLTVNPASPVYLGNFALISWLARHVGMWLGLAQSIWTVLKYVRYPVHISDLLQRHWAQHRKKALESPLDVYQRKKSLPIS